jgi:HEXXH motif-containing protein
VTTGDPLDLTLPRPGSTTAHRIVSGALRKLFDLRTVFANAPPMSRDVVRSFASMVTFASKGHAGALASAFRYPSLSALLRCARDARGESAHRLINEANAVLCLELACASALSAPVRVDAPPTTIVAGGARRAVTQRGEIAPITFENGSISFGGSARVAASDLDRPFVPIAGHLDLALVDNNPLAMVEAHPDKHGNAVDLGGRAPSEWALAFADALAIIRRYVPEIADEIALVITQIVPVGFHAERHESASFREAIGTIYASLHPDTMTLAEALIHEHQHNKLNTQLELAALLENDPSELVVSPVRPDARPLIGVLLAVHAFVPVATLYDRMIAQREARAANPRFAERAARVHAINEEGLAVLEASARPTEIGAALLAELRMLIS